MLKDRVILFVQIVLVGLLAVALVDQLGIVPEVSEDTDAAGSSSLELGQPAINQDSSLRVEEAAGEPEPLNVPLQGAAPDTPNQGSSPGLQEQNQSSLQPNAGSGGIDREDL